MAIEKKNAWEKYPQGPEREKLFAFAEDYRRFISGCKTERECTAAVYADATGHGFVDLDELIETGKSVKAGDKIIANNMGKGLALFIVGSKPLEKGMNILGAHIDSPRMDLKQVPLYEDTDMALLDTHYYGGIKKYQWVTLPLALHGVIVKKDGTKVMSVNLLLEHESDPVIWRGPVIAGAVKQFWTETLWQDVDYMFVDMPPGTGDVPLTVFQSLPVDGIIIVTSPQELVSMIVAKAVNMAKKMDIPILGVVENMSYLECPDCKKHIHVFGESHVEQAAQENGLKVLAQIPIDPKIAQMVDGGRVEYIEMPWFEKAAEAVEAL